MDKRYQVIISNPRVTDGKMLVMVNIKEWDEYHCFYYPLDSIDDKAVHLKAMWKFSGDVGCVLYLSVEADIEQKKPELLNLKNWGF